VLKNKEIGFAKVAFHQSLAGKVTINYYLPGTTTINAVSSSGVVITLEKNGLALRLKSKKVTETRQ